jgi:hypothetical protein
VSVFRILVGGAVTVVWVVGYVMAYFVDPSLSDLASSSTKVMLPVVSFLFALEGLSIIRGKP